MPQFPAVVVWASRVYRRATTGIAGIVISVAAVLLLFLSLDCVLATLQWANRFAVRVYKYSGNEVLANAHVLRAERYAERRRKLLARIH